MKLFIPLDEKTIRNNLEHLGFNTPFMAYGFTEIDSTNQFLKDCSEHFPLSFCWAEQQTAGRGRFGRPWRSPFGENIYFSARWVLHCPLSSLSGLSLVVGLAIITTLKKYDNHSELVLKWPNDVLWRTQKLAGILIEGDVLNSKQLNVIIGIGLNVNSSNQEQALSDKPWCSLRDMTGCFWDRNDLLAELIFFLDHYLKIFLKKGLSPFMNEWEQVDYLHGQLITISQNGRQLKGYVRGIDNEGRLILQDELSIIHHLCSGEASLSLD